MLGKLGSNTQSKTLKQCIGYTLNISKRYKQTEGMQTFMTSSTEKMHEIKGDINYRAINLSAGPSAIDLEVLQDAKREFTNYMESGMGIFEMSHVDQTGHVQKLMSDVTFRIGKLLQIPYNYQIFFMHGGANLQFGAIPLNICGMNNNENSVGGYINSGYCSQRAKTEANKFVNTVDICKDDGKCIPDVSQWKIPENCDYIHLCANETISGIEFLKDPELPTNSPPLIGDFSSTLFSRPIDIDKYGMIYASSGYNFGPSGLCIVIIKDELLEKCKKNMGEIPGILSWNEFVSTEPTHSLYNKPAIFQIWILDLILQTIYGERFDYDINKVSKWVKRRANTIYQVIDQFPQIYKNDIDPLYRSQMNIPFRCFDFENMRVDSVLEYKFLKQGEQEWFINNMEGDENIGGMRVSLYTQIPDDSIKCVAKFIKYFAESHSE